MQRDALFTGMFRLRPKWYLFVYLTARLGLGRGEVYGITRGQILRAPPRLIIDRAVQRGTKIRPAKVITRKNNDAYELELTEDVMQAIERHISQGLAGPEYLFSQDGTFPRYLDSYVGPLATVQRKLGLAELSHRKLGRHSVASQASDNGESAKSIQWQLGHKSEASTRKYIQRGGKAQLRLVTNLQPATPPHQVALIEREYGRISSQRQVNQRKQAVTAEAVTA